MWAQVTGFPSPLVVCSCAVKLCCANEPRTPGEGNRAPNLHRSGGVPQEGSPVIPKKVIRHPGTRWYLSPHPTGGAQQRYYGVVRISQPVSRTLTSI